jgi:hypothetical protein
MDAKMKMKHEAMMHVLNEIAKMANSAMGEKMSGMKKPNVSVEIEQEDGEEDYGSEMAKSESESMDKPSEEDDKMKLLKAKAMMSKK